MAADLRVALALIVAFATLEASAQTKRPKASPPPAAPVRDALMDTVLATGGNGLKAVLANPEKYRFQVVYGAVPPAGGRVERHGFRADAEYFFPASSMKVPIVLAAYARLGALRAGDAPGASRDAKLRLGSVTTNLESETWRALIASDNESANRLLSFVGHREVHEINWAFELASIRVRGRFSTGGALEPVEDSPRIEMALESGKAFVTEARHSDLVLPPTEAKGLEVGEAQVVNGKRVAGAMSFADKNAARLVDLQDALAHIVRPDLLPSPHDKQISDDDRAHLLETLRTLPSESGIAGFDRNVVADYRLRPFLKGLERVVPRAGLVVHSKIGQAYGFTIDNAYVVEKATGKAFFLTAIVYANPNETLNDDVYGYDSVANPALADLAEAFARHAFGK
jgi:hypothetical protein